MKMRGFSVYLRNGKVLLPTTARTPNGLLRTIDPVFVVSVADRLGLRQALKETLARGNPSLDSSVYADTPESSLRKLAGVRSWSAFEQGTSHWTIIEKDSSYKLQAWKKGPERGWVPDPDKTIALPTGATADDVVERMTEILQEAGHN
jgi:hypothetical protein